MKKVVFLFITFSIASIIGHAQVIIKKDTAIEQMVNEVSASHIQFLIEKLVSFHTRHTLSDTISNKTGIGAARNWILQEMQQYAKESNGRLQVSFDSFLQPADGRRVSKPTIMKNVLAILPGTDTSDKRILIVSGHYDSRASNVNDIRSFAPGANDDASGTAVAMELARVMSKRQFSSTIIFVAMVGEEQGLYGARHLALKAKEQNWNVHAMVTNDIVGNTYSSETNLKDNISVRIFSEGVPVLENAQQAKLRTSIGSENDGKARQLARYFKEVAERYVNQLEVKLIYRNDRYLRGGDHTPFVQEGFPAVRITEMNENFNRQHQNVRKENGIEYGDVPDFVDYEYVQKVARMNLAAFANLALSPQEPDTVNILASQLTNYTTLTWKPPLSKNIYGYYVVMRETTNAFWEKKFFTTNTSITLPYSKDNYFFGVQSVDEAGHESVVVFPKPAF